MMISPIGVMRPNKAFTLIEILMVIVILGIVLAIAVPNFSKGFSRMQLDRTADDLLSVSRWAQAMAIGQQRIYALSFADDRRSYGMVREKIGDEAEGKDHFEAIHGNLGRHHLIPEAVHLLTHADRIEFYPDGTIDQATIQLTSSAHKVLLSSSEVRGMLTKVSDE